MRFDRFKFKIVAQAILLCLTPLIFFHTVTKEALLVTNISLVGLWIAQVAFLIHYLQKTNRELALFILAIKNKDSSIRFNRNRTEGSFKLLYEVFNEVSKNLQQTKIEKHSEQQYFKYTVEHIGVGLISFDKNGVVEICNNATLSLFNCGTFTNINSLNQLKEGFENLLLKMKSGQTELLLLKINNELKQIAIRASEFKIENRSIKLVSLQDIRSEIEQGELDAWQKLIRVLTHEIVNSVSPITMLTSSLIDMLDAKQNDEQKALFDDETTNNILLGLRAIKKRSGGLKKFVESYRCLTKVPEPYLIMFPLASMIDHIEALFQHEFNNRAILFQKSIEPDNLHLTADDKLIEQVLINLVKNAIEAVENIERPHITLTAYCDDSFVFIKVADNGIGIPEELIDQVFVPFFTTKTHGSGIGLSLSRQIMRRHNATISVQSEAGKTVFSLKLIRQ